MLVLCRDILIKYYSHILTDEILELLKHKDKTTSLTNSPAVSCRGGVTLSLTECPCRTRQTLADVRCTLSRVKSSGNAFKLLAVGGVDGTVPADGTDCAQVSGRVRQTVITCKQTNKIYLISLIIHTTYSIDVENSKNIYPTGFKVTRCNWHK